MSPDEPGEALRQAAKRRDLDGVRRLLAERPDVVHGRDERGRTALFHSRHLPIVEALLAAGAEVDAPDEGGGTPLLRHAVAGGPELLALLLRHGARIDARDRDGWTALHAAAAFTSVDSMKLLLDHGADPQARTRYDYAPIHEALDDGNVVTARWLWEGPGPRDAFGAAALDEVAELKRLLGGSDLLDAQDGRGRTALHWAARCGKPRAGAALVERGAALDRVDERGWTPLHWAAWGYPISEKHGGPVSRDFVAALLDHGADPSPRAKDGKTPLDLAIGAQRVKPLLIALLESRGARSTPIPGEER